MTFLQPTLDGLTDNHLSDRSRIIQVLGEFRREWQEATGHESLLTIQAPIGLLLSDIADRLELTPQERHAMLGGQLASEIKVFMEQSVRR